MVLYQLVKLVVDDLDVVKVMDDVGDRVSVGVGVKVGDDEGEIVLLIMKRRSICSRTG